MDIPWLRSRPAPEDHLYALDDSTVVADGAAGLAGLAERLQGAHCLVVDLTRASDLSPEAAATVVAAVHSAVDRGLCVAIARPGTEVVRALGNPRRVQLAATLDEALACVRGRLTPMPTIRILEDPQAA
jgi:hypothetical protein